MLGSSQGVFEHMSNSARLALVTAALALAALPLAQAKDAPKAIGT